MRLGFLYIEAFCCDIDHRPVVDLSLLTMRRWRFRNEKSLIDMWKEGGNCVGQAVCELKGKEQEA